jgi:hypothetical protein
MQELVAGNTSKQFPETTLTFDVDLKGDFSLH